MYRENLYGICFFMLVRVLDNTGAVGQLQVNVVDENNAPVNDAKVTILDTENQVVERVQTDSSGQTQDVSLFAPPMEYSLDENSDMMPYANYNLRIEVGGIRVENILNVEILPGELALQNVRISQSSDSTITIAPHTLYADYPEKIPEEEIKDINESGDIVLSRVVIPEYVVVHDGTPQSNAKDYYVLYRDYIKNVASSEIYATWPEETLKANILAIMSFTLNRVYTEWYRNKGYDFTITSSTAYDQKWINGRNVYESISRIVDDIFNQYLSKPDVKQPLLTQYCDGKKVTCPNWLSQWGSFNLGEQGKSAIQILRNYYGREIYINSAEQISGVPASWPGYDLTVGSRGQKVMQLQEQLDTIAKVYTAIPRIAADGIYGEKTKEAVSAFQKIFNLPVSGVTDFATWYKISQIYVGITRIGEGVDRN